jgi:methionyl-tRNA formyltransferase
LQNLIAAGQDRTMLSAIRMTSELDAGPVYAKRPLSLCGTAEAVYIRASDLAGEMIAELIADWPEPVEQSGEVTTFRRRTPSDSRIEDVDGLDALHDLIRMLDAEEYPAAFLEHGGFRFEFRRSARYDGRVEADVRVTLVEDR